MGFLSTNSGIFLAIPREFFKNLSDPQKKEAIILFEKYRGIFSKTNFDLGCAADVEHKVNTQGHAPFKAGLSKDLVLVMKKLLLKSKNC